MPGDDQQEPGNWGTGAASHATTSVGPLDLERIDPLLSAVPPLDTDLTYGFRLQTGPERLPDIPRRRRLRDTKSFCLICSASIPATLYRSEGHIFIRKHCPVHGDTDILYARDSQFYDAVELNLRVAGVAHQRGEGKPRGAMRAVYVDLTERCNLHCPSCLATSSPTTPRFPPPELGPTLAKLATLDPAPVVFISGGEPTLVKDLANWIYQLRKRDYDVKLLSNGIRIASERGYLQSLKDAGLDWLCLQFDTLDDEKLLVLRRRALADVRRKALAACSELGIKTVMSVMVGKGVNDQELGTLLKLCWDTPGVHQLTLLPSRRIGRSELTTDASRMEATDVMDELYRQTDGSVRKRDWLRFQLAQSLLYRLTREPDYGPRHCFFSLLLVGDSHRFAPATRLGHYLRRPGDIREAYRFARDSRRVERIRFSDRVMVVTVEEFREKLSVDIHDSEHTCTRYQLQGGELHPVCMFNMFERFRSTNPELSLELSKQSAHESRNASIHE